MFIDNNVALDLSSVDKIEKAINQNIQNSTILINENKSKNTEVTDLLNKILKFVEPVDFRKHASLENEKDKLQKKHYLVSTIEIIIQISNNKGLSLCRNNDTIYIYNSEYWVNINPEIFTDFLGSVALKMGVDKYESKHYKFKEELYKQFLSDGGLNKIKPNNTTTLINLENGTFEISQKKVHLRPFKKEDFITYQLPFKYDKNASSPLFQRFLDEVIPEAELQKVLSEFLGYIFIKNNILKLEKCLLLYGTGANGKSVFFEIIMALLGNENTTNYTLQSLTQENSKSRINIEHKLLNYASEINGKLESHIFKALISGEPMEVPVLYKQSQIMTDYARFMFNCNELPKEVENTNAFFRRFLIVPFRKTIPLKEQDKKLADKIINQELSGVFNWVLDGLNRLIKSQEFTTSNIIENEVLQYQKQSDSVLMFIEEENYTQSTTTDTPLKTIYSEYKDFCNDSGLHSCSRKTFSLRLKKNKYKIERKNYGNCVYIQKKVI